MMRSFTAKEAINFFHSYELKCDERSVQEWLDKKGAGHTSPKSLRMMFGSLRSGGDEKVLHMKKVLITKQKLIDYWMK